MRSIRVCVIAVLLLAPAALAAAEDACDVKAPRVVAVGDVHGAYENFVKVLRMMGIIDEKVRWAGGTTHLVQTGDVLDRGIDGPKVLDLLMRLEKEAEKAGGRVHALLGNHEVMNMLGDFRYVNPEEYVSFQTPDSMRRIQRFYRDATDRARQRAREAGEEFDADAFRKKLEKQAPLGFVERIRAFSASGDYGRWLRRRDVVIRINGVVFVHGGLTPKVAALGCKAINDTVKREIATDFDETRSNPGATLAAAGEGPLWYRGLAQEDETTFTSALDEILHDMDARAIVVGHTVSKTGRIQYRFGGRVIMIDAGMSPTYFGSLAALEITPDGTMTARYPDGSEIIGQPAAADEAAADAPVAHAPAAADGPAVAPPP